MAILVSQGGTEGLIPGFDHWIGGAMDWAPEPAENGRLECVLTRTVVVPIVL